MEFSTSHHPVGVGATYKGIPATPRLALGELSNYARQHSSVIEATPKLRSLMSNPTPLKSSSDSEEYEEVECVREMKNDDSYEEDGLQMSPVLSPAEEFFDISGDDLDDGEYPPPEHMFIPPETDDYCISSPEPEDKEIFATMLRQDDLVPMYISADVKFFRAQNIREEDLEYEPMPDATLMSLDAGDWEL